ncbi:hypothetical protein [Amycolatopsis circi]|uniref:hypothetical protein n=1 Tax=Amycolatopsis circi TaxID=871959 RepID=UPI001FCA0279|nr:hypothetical protein [Amycolatopsis circi]
MDPDPSEPTQARLALTGAMHGAGAFLVSALVLCGLAVGVTAGSKELSLPVVLRVILLASFAQWGLFALPVAAGIGALVASLGQPKRPARRVWLTVCPLTLVFPILFAAVAFMRLG